MYQLYGDGVHDDAPAINEMLRSGRREVALPEPEREYAIGSTLTLHSNQTLRLGRYTTVKLLPNSDCLMVDAEENSENVSVVGGIWDFNNKNQTPNPFASMHNVCLDETRHSAYSPDYLGVVMRFYKIKNLYVGDLTVKDPVTFGVQMAFVEQFTVERLTFDFNDGNPWPINMDGVHLDGGCRFGVLRDLKGACYDDLVAVNADDFCDGPISDIVIDGVFSDDCHSAVRLLSAGSPVSRIAISNVYGTYFQYGIGFTRYFEEKGDGIFEAISMRNICISKAPRYSIYQKDGSYEYALVWVEKNLRVSELSVSELHRDERVRAVPLVEICENAEIGSLSIDGASQKNRTGDKCPMIVNRGVVRKLYLRNVDAGDDEVLQNLGEIQTKTEM